MNYLCLFSPLKNDLEYLVYWVKLYISIFNINPQAIGNVSENSLTKVNIGLLFWEKL